MRLRALTITNFASIGEPGITIPIDDIVVLIGPNNSGKSSVLDAYEAFSSTGSSLPLRSFRDEDPTKTVSIRGVFTDLTDEDRKTLGIKWEYDDPDFGKVVKVKWEWSVPDENAQKFSWNDNDSKWVAGGMGGWNTLITSRIPVPLRVRPTDDPDQTEKQIIQILTAAVKTALKRDSKKTKSVLNELQTLADEFAKDAQKDLDNACSRITKKLNDIFPDHKVSLHHSVEKIDPEKIIESGSHVCIEEPGKIPVRLSHQGAGMRRTFLWSALGSLAEIGLAKQGKKKIDAERQRILLIEEPESFLHPPIIRAARDALYDLAVIAEWQVLTCTHSPIFVDVSKPHTTIMRVEKKTTGLPRIFSTEDVGFSDEERTKLRMIRSCHPTVSEFFFADHVFLVEGETEQVVLFHFLADTPPQDGKWYHVVNCMGKANLTLFARILNQFGTSYTIVHDADSPMCRRQQNWVKNGMWTLNKSIAEVVSNRKAEFPPCSLIAHIPDFERFYFSEKLTRDKPFHAMTKLSSPDYKKTKEYKLLKNFAESVLSGEHPGCYSDYKDLTVHFKAWRENENPSPVEEWEIEKHE
ncbi:MAG: AAA family ATPase [Planctomycetes bacterium]|nr:AAA family ATPase [Planctomycetota bacterium]